MAHVDRLTAEERTEPPIGRRASLLAARQGGAISSAQLRDFGLSADRILWLVRAGWLAPQHRGVHRVGLLTDRGRLFAALLAMGDDATLSFLAAGHVHAQLLGRLPRQIDVTVRTRRRRRPGIRPHQSDLDPRDVTTRGGLCVTTVERTLLDLATVLAKPKLQAAVDETRARRRLRLERIDATIARAPGHHGATKLRRVVARHDPGRGPTRSAFEARARGFLRDRGFPDYERNHEIHLDGEVFIPDVIWPAQRVVLELDSCGFHDTDPVFARDRRKSRRLNAAGWHVVRATWEDFDERPDELATDLWALLAL